MSEEIMEKNPEGTNMEEVLIPARSHPFCVVSIDTFGEHEMHDIQTNTAWDENPYSKGYAVVPDEMVPDMLATKGFCNIVFNKAKTEVVGFNALEIPDIPAPEPEPTQEERIAELELKNNELNEILDALLGLEG